MRRRACRSSSGYEPPSSARASRASVSPCELRELVERSLLFLGRMSFVVPIDQAPHDGDLELLRRFGERGADLVEREHDFEEMLELGLRQLLVAGDCVADAGVDSRGVARREVARRARGRGAGANQLIEE